MEFTTYAGHANGIGATQYVDHRFGLPGISLDTAAWAARIRGVTVARGATPARLAAVAQRDSSLVLRATCDPGLVVEGTRSPALDLTVAEGTITRVHCVRP